MARFCKAINFLAARQLSIGAIALLVSVLAVAATAQGQTATFFRFTDALAGRCYDSAGTAPSGQVLTNQLNIAINSGVDPATFQNRACVASTLSGNPRLTMDTISFYVQAPAGFYISSLTFTQCGKNTGSSGGAGFRGATWVVDDSAMTVPNLAGGCPAESADRWESSLNLTGLGKTIVPVSITTYLAAFDGNLGGIGTASATSPVVQVGLTPLP
jgi:hypothetical protein